MLRNITTIALIAATLTGACTDPGVLGSTLQADQAFTGDTDTDDGSESCYIDDDLDGAYVEVTNDLDTDETCPEGGLTELRPNEAEDCDDSRSDRSPLRNEVCDGVDNDCDGQVDEGRVCEDGIIDPESLDCADDADEDGFADEDGSIVQRFDRCARGEVEVNNLDDLDDCDDDDVDVNPGEPEVCNDNIDNDCDGDVDEDDSECDDGGNGQTGNLTVRICVTQATVNDWDLGVTDLSATSQPYWFDRGGQNPSLRQVFMNERDSDGCRDFTMASGSSLLKFNGVGSSDAELWGDYLVGVDDGGTYALAESGGNRRSEVRVTVDGDRAEFCDDGSNDLCWSR